MTPRAIRILKEADLIAAEDTRHSRVLLSCFDIKTPLFSCHKFNEEKRGDFFIEKLQEGKSIALISDAGTPAISDPGHRIVRQVSAAGFPVVPVPGASAVIAALSASGFDGSQFSFAGFLPRKKKDILDALERYAPGIVCFYESPKRIISTLKTIADAYGEAQACICNDITKKFERIYRGSISDVLEELEENSNAAKGEYACVINIETAPPTIDSEENTSIEAKLVDIVIKQNCTLKEAATILKETNNTLGKKEIYAAMLNIKNLHTPQ